LETEWSFDGKLRQVYLYQKSSKSDHWFSRYSWKCWRFFWDSVRHVKRVG